MGQWESSSLSLVLRAMGKGNPSPVGAWLGETACCTIMPSPLSCGTRWSCAPLCSSCEACFPVKKPGILGWQKTLGNGRVLPRVTGPQGNGMCKSRPFKGVASGDHVQPCSALFFCRECSQFPMESPVSLQSYRLPVLAGVRGLVMHHEILSIQTLIRCYCPDLSDAPVSDISKHG